MVMYNGIRSGYTTQLDLARLGLSSTTNFPISRGTHENSLLELDGKIPVWRHLIFETYWRKFEENFKKWRRLY